MTFGDEAIAEAGKWLGQDYVWGGGDWSGPTGGGFDCSGLMMRTVFVASHETIRLPHRADIQRTMGEKVTKGQEQPGDLIAFSMDGGSFYHHIGLYIGNGMLRNAPETGKKVSDMSLSGWADETWEIRRFGVPASGAVGASVDSTAGQSATGPLAALTGGSNLPSAGVMVVVGLVAIVGLVLVFSQVGT